MRKNFTKTMMLVAAMLCGLSANAEAFTVSFDTMANWLWGFSATNYIVAWNNDGDITAPGTGDLMSFDEDENLYVWTAPEGKVPTKLYFHNGSGKRTWVFDAENGKTYNNLFNSVVISIDGESEDIWVDTEDGVSYMKDMLNIPAGTKFTIRDAIKEADLYWGGKTNMELGTVYELAKYGADCTLKDALENGTMEFNYANQTVKFSAFELAPHSWPEDGSVLTEFYMFEITYGPGDCTYSKVEGIDEPMVNVYRMT